MQKILAKFLMRKNCSSRSIPFGIFFFLWPLLTVEFFFGHIFNQNMQIKYILFALIKTIKYFICAKKKKIKQYA